MAINTTLLMVVLEPRVEPEQEQQGSHHHRHCCSPKASRWITPLIRWLLGVYWWQCRSISGCSSAIFLQYAVAGYHHVRRNLLFAYCSQCHLTALLELLPAQPCPRTLGATPLDSSQYLWQHHVSLESHLLCPKSFLCPALELPSGEKSHSHLHITNV